jgi:hypothetical protein
LINDNNNPVNSIGNIQSAANSLDQYNAAKKAAETGAQGVASGATGASSAVGNLGKAAGVAGGAISIGTDMASMLKVPDVQLANMQASSKGEMSSKINNFKGYDLGRVNVGKAALTGAAKGAAAGATFGP